MSKGKKQKTEAQNKRAYNATTNKTGRWRGKKASEYQKFDSGTKTKERKEADRVWAKEFMDKNEREHRVEQRELKRKDFNKNKQYEKRK